MLARVRAWARSLVRRKDFEREMTEEMRFHLEAYAADLVRTGVPLAEARRRAAMEFGGVESTKDDIREGRGLAVTDDIVRDVRYALRQMRAAPWFSATVVLTLALGIGANTAIFSVVNAVLLRPLPYPDPEALAQVWETNPGADRWGEWASFPDFLDWQREARAFDAMAAYRYGRLRLASEPYPEMLTALRTSPDLFRVLGTTAHLGRTFLPDDGQAGAEPVVILADGLWKNRFGGDAALVGQTISLDDRLHRIVGIMPPGFGFPAGVQGGARAPDVWIPTQGDNARGSHNYRVIARLRPGATLAQAQGGMDQAARLVAELDPAHRGHGAVVMELQAHAVAGIRPALYILTGAIALVLLIACSNVASLLLARGAARQKEIALRLALGAGARRVTQQSLSESLLLALLGGIAGLGVAFAGVRILAAMAPGPVLLDRVSLDPRVLAFTLLTTIATGIAFGIIPTLQSLRVDAHEALKEGTRQAGSSRRSRLRTMLSVTEIALALVLLIGAALLVRSFSLLQKVDIGFNPVNVLTAVLVAPPAAAADQDRTAAFFDQVVARIGQVPGVRAAAAASAVPLVSNETSPFRIEGTESSPGGAGVFAEQPKITPGYFATMGIPVVRGRPLDNTDARGAMLAVVVSEGLARRYWPNEDPIGRRLSIDGEGWRTVVGVARDVRHDGFDLPARPVIYVPQAQFARASTTILVRTDRDPMLLLDQVRSAVRELAPTQPLYGVQAMERVLGESLALRRFLMVLVSCFAAVAGTLGTVGVYSVMAYLVSERRREIGIRMALGTTQAGILWLIVSQGARLGITGIGLGALGSLALSRILGSWLFGVTATDPWSFTVIPAVLLAVVLLATWIPARAAAGIEPARTLRAG